MLQDHWLLGVSIARQVILRGMANGTLNRASPAMRCRTAKLRGRRVGLLGLQLEYTLDIHAIIEVHLLVYMGTISRRVVVTSWRW